MSRFLSIPEFSSVDLVDGYRSFRHRFMADDLQAINIAVAAGRPLLLRGAPGVGKSQLARAAAKARGAVFVSCALHGRTEPEDLGYGFDAVARLAEAQVLGALGVKTDAEVAAKLDERRFLSPGILWWAFDWGRAQAQATAAKRARAGAPESAGDANGPARKPRCPFQIDNGDPAKGVVVLLDEIDKAESSVPNGLLEALGHRRLDIPWYGEVLQSAAPLLVCITTNEERTLPDAFVRRCMVYRMDMPKREELLARAKAHAGEACSGPVIEALLDQLQASIEVAGREAGVRPPGQAELLDAVRALVELAPGDDARQKELLTAITTIAFQKHRRA